MKVRSIRDSEQTQEKTFGFSEKIRINCAKFDLTSDSQTDLTNPGPVSIVRQRKRLRSDKKHKIRSHRP